MFYTTTEMRAAFGGYMHPAISIRTVGESPACHLGYKVAIPAIHPLPSSSLYIHIMAIKFVLVTGATGFIGAHIVDALLARGLRVRGATRSMAKGEAMMKARPQYTEQLEFVQINDFESPGGLIDAVEGVDGIIHTASVSPPTFYIIIYHMATTNQ